MAEWTYFAGSIVGLEETLMGIPYLLHLRDAVPVPVRIWPFETGWSPGAEVAVGKISTTIASGVSPVSTPAASCG